MLTHLMSVKSNMDQGFPVLFSGETVLTHEIHTGLVRTSPNIAKHFADGGYGRKKHTLNELKATKHESGI